MALEFLIFAAGETLKKVVSVASTELSLAWGFKADLAKLQKSLIMIGAFLQDVRVSDETDQATRRWLLSIKDVVYDAEDVLGNVAYEKIRQEREVQAKLRNQVSNFFSKSNPFVYRLKIAHRIKKINQRLGDIKSEGAAFGFGGRVGALTQNIAIEIPETHAFLDSSQVVVERGDEVSEIVNLLVNSSNSDQRLSVISIVGMAGLGKTTLAKKVYDEVETKKLFDVTIWVCVSNMFDEQRILRGMLESIDASASGLEQKNPIVKHLREKLNNQRFLLILDDVWNHDINKWNCLREDLFACNGGNGNCMIVTTRDDKVAEVMESTPMNRHYPTKLTGEECWTIIKGHACDVEPISSNLEVIGRQIAQKCDGLPLLAKVLGGTMRYKKTEEEWSLIQHSDAWGQMENSKEIIPILKLSYDRLPTSSLKRCFTYCAVFQEDFVFQKEQLVRQWISQGYFQQPQNGKSLEDIGDEHFNFLVKCSLFQDVNYFYDLGITECKMHDAVHGLAQHIARLETWIYEKKNPHDISNVRFLNTSTRKDMLERIVEVGSSKKVLVLFLKNDVSDNLIRNFKRLRALNISQIDIKELPITIGKSKHLTYLDVSETAIKAFPNSITKLYNLQTLICRGCLSLEKLPEDVQHLFNLNYLDVSGTMIKALPNSVTDLRNLQTLRFFSCRKLKKFPKGVEKLGKLKHLYFDDPELTPTWIGRLTSLETLAVFRVGIEEGHKIEELGSLRRLKGELSIYGLENVGSKEEAVRVNLKGMSGLQGLKLFWDSGFSDVKNAEDVLGELQPHSDIQWLTIEGFVGEKFPYWLSNPDALPHLKQLWIYDSNGCIDLPTLSQFPKLRSIAIRGAPIRHIGSEWYWKKSEANNKLFPSLRILSLSYMQSMERLEAAAPIKELERITYFPNLTKVSIDDCPSLSYLSIVRGLKALKTLTILRCGLKYLPTELKECKFLESLSISHCDELMCIPDWLRELTSLTRLVISNCHKLTYFPGESLSHLTKLSNLRIGGFSEELEVFPPVPTWITSSLRHLSLVGWQRLEYLPCQIQYWTSLQTLSINGFTRMKDLPEWLGSLSSLRHLEILSCTNLKRLPSIEATKHLQSLQICFCPKFKEDEEEWSKISRIPLASVDFKIYEFGRLVED